MEIEYDADAPFHGTNAGYTKFGCRCEECTRNIRKYRAERRRINLARLRADPEYGASQKITHGASAYNDARCRCAVCTKAASEARKASAARQVERMIQQYGGKVIRETQPQVKKQYEAVEQLVRAQNDAEAARQVERGELGINGYTQKEFYALGSSTMEQLTQIANGNFKPVYQGWLESYRSGDFSVPDDTELSGDIARRMDAEEVAAYRASKNVFDVPPMRSAPITPQPAAAPHPEPTASGSDASDDKVFDSEGIARQRAERLARDLEEPDDSYTGGF